MTLLDDCAVDGQFVCVYELGMEITSQQFIVESGIFATHQVSALVHIVNIQHERIVVLHSHSSPKGVLQRMFGLIVDAHQRRAIYWHPHLKSPLLVNFRVLYYLLVVKQTMDVRDKIRLRFCCMDTNTKGEVALFGINATQSVLCQHHTVFSHLGIFPIIAVVDGVLVEQSDEPLPCSLIPQTEVETRFDLCITHHCGEDEQNGDDGLLHIFAIYSFSAFFNSSVRISRLNPENDIVFSPSPSGV